jgi:hypothetical protein
MTNADSRREVPHPSFQRSKTVLDSPMINILLTSSAAPVTHTDAPDAMRQCIVP